jgi:hypothetical protein
MADAQGEGDDRMTIHGANYAVNKVCHRVVHDPDFRQALLEDPEPALRAARPALSDEQVRALLRGDVGSLSRAGANNFMLHNLARFGVLGLDLSEYANRIREEYHADREEWRAQGLLPY